MQREKLLDIIIGQRMEKALDQIIETDKEYKAALKEQDKAFKRLDQIKSGKEQKIAIDRAIDANNHCGAVYGEAAYRLGLRDGLRLALEVRVMCRR